MSDIIEINQDDVNEKGYTLRALCARDVFPMSKIISKIGMNEFTKAFDKDDVKNLVASLQGNQNLDDVASIVGINVILNVTSVILGNISSCEQEIYSMLSSLSGMTKKDIESLPMNVFFEMIVDVIKKEEFKDFFKVVSRLLKSGN